MTTKSRKSKTEKVTSLFFSFYWQIPVTVRELSVAEKGRKGGRPERRMGKGKERMQGIGAEKENRCRSGKGLSWGSKEN